MITSDKGIALLKGLEGFSPICYYDSAGLPTIGYGSLIDTAAEQWLIMAHIDEKTAEVLLRTDLRPAEKAVNQYVTSILNQNQFDALVIFTYNVGAGAFKSSTLLKLVNKDPNDPNIKEQFLRWNKVGKNISEGLSHRRLKEVMLYFSKEL